jgi:hypothetical protein
MPGLLFYQMSTRNCDQDQISTHKSLLRGNILGTSARMHHEQGEFRQDVG